MVNYIVFGVVVVIGAFLIYKEKMNNKKFQKSVDQFNGIFNDFIAEYGIGNIDFYTNEIREEFIKGNKKKIKPYLVISLGKEQANKGFDFLVVELDKRYETTTHKHRNSSVFLYILNGSIDVYMYPSCIDCHLPGVECDKSNEVISTIKNKNYFFIPSDICHKLVANKNTKLIKLFIPSIIKQTNEIENRCFEETK